MKLKISIAILALVAVAGFAHADDGGGDGGDNGNKSMPAKGRTFTYTASDNVSQDFSKAGNVTLKSRTTINVDPYLYITGNLSANWTVDGWGVGSDTETNTILFYHNETLTLQLQQFGNPAKVSGSKTGDQTVSLQGDLAFYNNSRSKPLFDSGMVNIGNLNTMFQASGPSFGAAQTGGLMKMQFSRKITITPSTGPGVYTNAGTITVIRN